MPEAGKHDRDGLPTDNFWEVPPWADAMVLGAILEQDDIEVMEDRRSIGPGCHLLREQGTAPATRAPSGAPPDRGNQLPVL